jgi:protein-S-isoprenylcysteine O-methyltransferase Ste14
MNTRELVFLILQFLFFIIFIVAPAGYSAPFAGGFISFILTITGIILIALSIANRSKKEDLYSSANNKILLSRKNIYSYIRQPRYTGILLILVGIALYTASIPKLLVTAIIFIFYFYKARYEEKKSDSKLPKYSDYKKITGRFLPKNLRISKHNQDPAAD